MEQTYERYHQNRKLQKRLITKNDYTYQGVLFFLNKLSLKNKEVLDIGCGVGTIDFYLVNEGAKVLGIDISNRGIYAAQLNARNFEIKQNLEFKIFNFPKKYPNKLFDIILCLEVLEHLKDDKLAVIKMKKMLNKNGIIISSSPSKNSFLYRHNKLIDFDREVGHLRRYTEKGFRSLFVTAGLNILEFKKTQSLLRDYLFTSSFGGKLLRIVSKPPFSAIITAIDNLMIPIFGESDLFIVSQRK